MDQVRHRGGTFKNYIVKFGACFKSVVSMSELKPHLKTKLKEEYGTEADLNEHKNKLIAWVREALYPDHEAIEALFKKNFKDKRESLYTEEQLNEKIILMAKRKRRQIYLSRFFNELLSIYKTIGDNDFAKKVANEVDEEAEGINPFESAINLKPPFYILVVGPPMSGKTVTWRN
jgi:hypothetical protein